MPREAKGSRVGQQDQVVPGQPVGAKLDYGTYQWLQDIKASQGRIINYLAVIHNQNVEILAQLMQQRSGMTKDDVKEVVKRLKEFSDTLQSIANPTPKGATIMGDTYKGKAIPPELQGVIDEIKQGCTDVAAKVDALQSQIATGMTPDDVASVKEQLQGISDSLKNVLSGGPSTPPTP